MRRPSKQLELPRAPTWGGARPGAGRKLVAPRPSPSHDAREPHEARCPVLVTLRTHAAIPSLRSERIFPAICRAISASMLLWFRVTHFSIQRDHVHLIVEGDDSRALTTGIQGLAARAAKAVNRAAGRSGPVWSGRYHAHTLRSPTEARRGIAYVLLNFRKHLRATTAVDPRSSGPWFDGWRSQPPALEHGRPVAAPRTWLGSVGWLRAGGGIHAEEVGGVTARASSRRSRSRRR
jgi:hypothetical protein